MFIPTYIGTKKTSAIGDAVCVYLEKLWGFKKDDLVNITIYRLNDPDKLSYMGTKKVSQCGSGTPVFLDKIWGIPRGEIVVISVQKLPMQRE